MSIVPNFSAEANSLSTFLPAYRVPAPFFPSHLPLLRKQGALITSRSEGIHLHNHTDDVETRFGRRLRRLRQERRMTQGDMAKKFGIDRSYISDVERGRKSMTLSMLEVIAIGMNVSMSKLFENI